MMSLTTLAGIIYSLGGRSGKVLQDSEPHDSHQALRIAFCICLARFEPPPDLSLGY
jgi:hypothetical protein